MTLCILVEIIVLLAASISDLRTMTVPLWLLPAAIGVETIILILIQGNHREAFICAGAAFFIMLLPAVYGNGGGADALAACSLCLALDGIHGLYALILGETLTIPYLLIRKKGQEEAYPLLPFLLAGFTGIFMLRNL